MATLYWGGGTGTWDGFDNSHWYTDVARTTLSARAPSVEDDVVFDSASNATAYTVTIANSTTVCRDVTIAGPASGNLTLAGSGTWFIYGSLTFPATGLIRTFTTPVVFYGTGSHTITTNGVTLASGFNFNGSGTYTLQDALNLGTSNILVNAGVFDTNGKNLTCGSISATAGTTAGTLTLGSSTVSATTINPNAPVTINAGTSNITLSAISAGIGNGPNYTGNTFYNVTFSSASISTSNFYSNNTFNNLTFTTKSAVGVSNVVLFGNQTVNGTLTIAGQSSVNRYFVQSNTIGTPRTLTVGTVATLTDVDFRDITVAGTSSPWSGTRLGNCLGNTNITFVAGVNKYIAAATASSNWSANIWSSTSGGPASTADFPLAQDTVIIDNAGLSFGATLTLDIAYNIGGFDASSRTNSASFTISSVQPFFHGDVTFSTAIGGVRNVSVNYCGRATQTITTNNRAQSGVIVNSPGGTVKFADNFTAALGNSISLINGTLDCNNKNVDCLFITASGSEPKTLMLGSGTITTSQGVGSFDLISNLTVTSNTATITCNNTSTIGFNGITAIFGGNITATGASVLRVIAGTTTIANLTIATSATATGVTPRLQLTGDLTVTGTLALAGGASATQRAFVYSNTIGTQRTITAATVTGLSDIDFRDINVAGTADWTTGTRLGDCGGNSGITFPAPKTVYWNLAGTQNWSATAWATSSGGTPAANNFPLAQDTAVFDDGLTSTTTAQMNAAWNVGSLDASARTVGMTLFLSSGPTVYGNVIYGSGVSVSGTGTTTFSGRGTQTYTTAGLSLLHPLTIDKPSGTFQHGDAYTSVAAISVFRGGYTTQNYNVSATQLSGSGSNTRSITLGTSTLTLSGTAPVTFTTSTGLTFSGASSTINLSSTGNKLFAGGGQTFGTVSSTGGTASTLTINQSNTFGTLTNSAYTYMIWGVGTTQTITNFTYSGASGSVVRWYTSTPGQRATIKQSATGGSLAAVGANSVDGGNNSGLTFTGTSPNYFYVKDIAYFAIYNGGPNFFAFF